MTIPWEKPGVYPGQVEFLPPGESPAELLRLPAGNLLGRPWWRYLPLEYAPSAQPAAFDEARRLVREIYPAQGELRVVALAVEFEGEVRRVVPAGWQGLLLRLLYFYAGLPTAVVRVRRFVRVQRLP
jgi:hypothetical protein